MKFFADIYCKIYTDNYPDMEGAAITADELYQHLTEDVGCCFDESENIIPGDLAIWYLGSNEKFGHIKIILPNGKMFFVEWSFGESSFNNVRNFLEFCKENSIFSELQLKTLFDLVEEGEQIDDMYEISSYLKSKKEGSVWVKPNNKTREDMKKYIGCLQKNMERDGFETKIAGKDY